MAYLEKLSEVVNNVMGSLAGKIVCDFCDYYLTWLTLLFLQNYIF